MRNSNLSITLMLTMAFLCSTAWAAEDTALIAHWALDERQDNIAYDSVGICDGTVYGAQWTADGQINGALGFDGNADYVMVGDKAELERQVFTLSFWAQLNNPLAPLQGGIAKGSIFGSTREFSYKAEFSNGFARAGVTNTSNAYFGIIAPIEDSGWHMWTMTVDDSVVTLYKDAIYQNSITYTGTIDVAKTNNNFTIGARDNGNYSLDGKIDDVRFYGQCLTADGVEQLYLAKPAVLLSLEITGPNEVPDYSETQFTAIAYYDDETSKDVTSDAQWFIEPDTFAEMDMDTPGLLIADQINYHNENITIYAQYAQGKIKVDTEKILLIFAACFCEAEQINPTDGQPDPETDEPGVLVPCPCTTEQLIQRNIATAIEIKEQITEDLELALAKENAANDMLQELQKQKKKKGQDQGPWSQKQITMARGKVIFAMIKEMVSKRHILHSIKGLQQALDKLSL